MASETGDPAVPTGERSCRCEFHLTPPRHLWYPALLLLLAEEPRHGYLLVDDLRRLGFGPVSRPSVYRALNDLERDDLLESSDAEPLAGSVRRVYAVTPAGHRQLREWMEVVGRERDALDGMIRRFVGSHDRSIVPFDPTPLVGSTP